MRNLIGSVQKRIINMSQFDLYAVDISGRIFCVPGTLIQVNFGFADKFIKFEVETSEGVLESKVYPFPIEGCPSVIKPFGLMIFLTQKELNNEIKKFGSPANLVQTYMTEETNLYFGAGKSIVNMSRNDYWITEANRVFKIPRCDDVWRAEYMQANGLTEQDLGEKDLIVIYTYVGGDTREGRLRITNYTNRWVKRFNKNGLEPIILDDSNVFIFNSKEAAEFFVTKYDGKLIKYIESLAAVATAEQHKEEIREINSEYKKDKLAIAKTAALMGGSAILGGLIKFGLERLLPKKEAIFGLAGLGGKALGLTLPSIVFPPAAIIIGAATLALGLCGAFAHGDGILGSIGRFVRGVKRKIGNFFYGIGEFLFG